MRGLIVSARTVDGVRVRGAPVRTSAPSIVCTSEPRLETPRPRRSTSAPACHIPGSTATQRPPPVVRTKHRPRRGPHRHPTLRQLRRQMNRRPCRHGASQLPASTLAVILATVVFLRPTARGRRSSDQGHQQQAQEAQRVSQGIQSNTSSTGVIRPDGHSMVATSQNIPVAASSLPLASYMSTPPMKIRTVANDGP